MWFLERARMSRLFAKISLGLADDPKIVGLSDKAFRAFIEGILYARQNLTDGFLDERIVQRRWGVEVADELTANDGKPSWVKVEGGWQIYAFTDWQMSAEVIAETREKRRSAARKRWDSKSDANAMQDACKPDANVMPETETETKTETKTETPRASTRKRLRGDWKPDENLMKWAKEKKITIDLEYETEQFVNWWIANGGVKADWPRTWQNWISRKQRESVPVARAEAEDPWWLK
jgi:hypothetical protein